MSDTFNIPELTYKRTARRHLPHILSASSITTAKMAFALRSLLLLCGISGLLTGVWCETVEVPCCPTGWVRLRDRCFVYRDDADLNYLDAEAACNGLGGNLATVRDSVENALILQLVKDANAGSFDHTWFGLHDGFQESKFVRIDGVKSKFFFWGQDQPDNFSGNEDCAEIYPPGQWNDENCADEQHYLCSIDLW
ncbi:galactose-specific lectin nattectin-like [Festucalex cinctus]